MTGTRYSTVAEYLADVEASKRETLQAVLDFLMTEFPQVQPKIAWNAPNLHVGGKYVFSLSAFKQHLRLSPMSQTVMTAFADRLRDYSPGSLTFQVPIDWPLDRALLRDLMTARLAELAGDHVC